MSKILTTVLLIAIIAVSNPALAAAGSVTSTDLIEKAKELDGQVVVFTGEVIGDIMVRGDHTWINISDGGNAVGIWVQNEDMQGITLPGRYGVHGDEVSITGTFRRACPEHGGDLDIHATSVQVLDKGYAIAQEITPIKVAFAAVLLPASAFLFVLMIRKHRRHQQ